jgi:tRNA modification GTPase
MSTGVPNCTAALLTPPGRGAVATIQLNGGGGIIDAVPPLFRAANGKPLAAQPINRVCFGHWGEEPAEEVVVCRVSDRVTEINCHGGSAAVARILGDLEARGCRIETWQESLRASGSLLDAECTEALTQALTLRTADILLEQQSGLLRSAIEELRTLASDEALRRIDEMLRWARFGRHLTQPWQVVLCGRPNVGKSSLINALVGYTRSIVYHQPGTTRDVVTAETAFDGWPVELSDTAGIRDQADELESAGIDRAQRRLAEADLRIIVLDTSQPPHEDDRQLLTAWPDALIVAHKSDLPNVWGGELPQGALIASSKTGEGIEKLVETIPQRLVPEVPPPGTATPVTQRQVELLYAAAEALRSERSSEYVTALERCVGSPPSTHPDAAPP